MTLDKVEESNKIFTSRKGLIVKKKICYTARSMKSLTTIYKASLYKQKYLHFLNSPISMKTLTIYSER